MKRYSNLILVLFSIIIINSCNSIPTSPIEIIPSDKTVFHQISIAQTNYQSFIISSNDKLILRSKNVSSIILGKKNFEIFEGNDTTAASYEQLNNNFQLNFNLNQVVDDSILVNKFTVRYVFYDNSFYDVDTFKVTYKYPYNSTEIFIKWSDILIPPSIDIQAFNIIDSNIYFHPYGCEGMYKYDMVNSHTTLIIDYCGGDYLATSPNYVFCDLYHNSIGRYNLTLDSLDLNILISPNYDFKISGMDVYDNKLYVATDDGKILIFDFNLQYEGMISYAIQTSWLAIKDNIAYSNDYHNIVKYNLDTQSFMDSIDYPTSNCEAIAILGDKIFFTDDAKKIIGYFNLSDIQ